MYTYEVYLSFITQINSRMQYVEWITKPIFISIHGLFDYVGNGGLLKSIEEVGLYPLGAGASRNGRVAAFPAREV